MMPGRPNGSDQGLITHARLSLPTLHVFFAEIALSAFIVSEDTRGRPIRVVLESEWSATPWVVISRSGRPPLAMTNFPNGGRCSLIGV